MAVLFFAVLAVYDPRLREFAKFDLRSREREKLGSLGTASPTAHAHNNVWGVTTPVRLGLSLANRDHVTCCLVPDWLPANNLWIVPLPSANCVANLIPLAV